MAEDEGNEAIVQTILILAGHLGMNLNLPIARS